jgi:DNA adenine methylase
MLFFVERCRSKKVEFLHADFRETLKNVRVGDVVYEDPPYSPISLTSSFSSYDAGGFSVKDQNDLVNIASSLSVPVLISNNDTEYTSRLYNKASYIKKISAGRFIGGDRKSVVEILALFNSKYKEKTLWSN